MADLSNWHWRNGRIIRHRINDYTKIEECGDRRVLEENLQILREVQKDYLDSALKTKKESRATELRQAAKDRDKQIAWVKARLKGELTIQLSLF